MRDDVQEILDDSVLRIFQTMRRPRFPVDPLLVFRLTPNCRVLSYEKLAKVSHMEYDDVVIACGSYDGCTFYDIAKDRYLTAVNTSERRGAGKTRVRWTAAHELGHISAGHFQELAELGSENASPSDFKEMEDEANYFAASFLAPIPAMKILRVQKPADIRDWFGLSQSAAEYRWEEMKTWIPDPKLEEYFTYFTPVSLVKNHRRLHRKPTIDPEQDCAL
jgi:hypothetical protein